MKHLPKIIYRTIPHTKQRYQTIGDYYHTDGVLNVRVSKSSANHEFLVLIHELVEWYLTSQKGVTIDVIDQFDIAYEKNRKVGDKSEPGNDPSAPYFHEHQFATEIEKMLAQYLGVNWEKYSSSIQS